MPDTTLQLGDFVFARFEVPEQISFGGEQRLVVHDLVGGARIIDAMGETPQALEWSGFFVGSAALDRALYVDGLRKAGQTLTLSWSRLRFTVVVRRLECQFQRFYRLPYRITLEVVSDETSPVAAVAAPSPEQLVGDDLASALALGSDVGDAGLLSLLATVSDAISSLGSFAAASPSQLGQLAGPISAARSYAMTLLAGTDAPTDAIVGGIVPGQSASVQSAALSAQIAAVSAAPSLILINRLLGRMAANVSAVNGGTKSVVTAGGDLFAIAADQYGDVRGWTAIAGANGIVDPQIAGITSLTIPPLPPGADGILNG